MEGEIKLNQLQILSHQSKISTKVEIYLGRGDSYHSATFKRLGYLSLDNNERSSYQARELKTVFIDKVGKFLKLIVNENHVNKLNIYNQVGIVALSVMGNDDSVSNEYDESNVNRSAPAIKRDYPKASNNPYYDLSVDINLDPQTANKLRQLADAKARAIQVEDYLTAKQIKISEEEVKTLGSKLAQLDMAKSEAVSREDYDLAKELKDEADDLRHQIEDKVRNYFCNVP